MKLNRKNLLEALQIVSPGLSKREFIDQATFFAFVVDRVITYNDSISISHPVDGLDLDGAVIADEFLKLLKKVKQDEVELAIDGPSLHVVAGKTNAWLNFDKKVKLPLDELVKNKWKTFPKEVADAIRFVHPICGKDNLKPLLTTVHVNNAGFVEASDSYRVIRYSVPKFDFDTFLLPRESVKTILDISPVKISQGNGWVHFKNDRGTIVSTRIFDQDVFPDCNRFLNVTGIEFEIGNNVSEAVERSIIFNDAFITVTVSGTKIQIQSESASAGKFMEHVDLPKSHDGTIAFKINPLLFKSMLDSVEKCYITDHMIIFKGENWKQVTMLILQ